jgi:glycosyltransferase involved in cell wall biosynthesis
MRILYVISELTYGGAQKQLVELARELSQNGNEVAIYTLNRDVPRQNELAGSGVTLIVDQKRSRLDFRLLGRLRGHIQAWRPDVIHSFLFDGDFYSRLAALGTGIPVINSERSHNYTLPRLNYLAHRLTCRLAQAVIANTHAGKAFAEKLFGFPPDDVHVVGNGLRVEELERQAASPSDFKREFFGPGEHRVACLVGSIKPAKDYRLALDAADRLVGADPRWRVLLIGDQLAAVTTYRPGRDSDSGDYKSQMLSYYETLKNRESIRFTGLRTDVPALVRQCDVLYITSVHEGSPNAVLEAMALGVPVVSTDYSDIRRMLPFAEQVISDRDASKLSQAILWAHEHRAEVGARQRQWVQRHGRIEGAALELERIYRKYIRAEISAQLA